MRILLVIDSFFTGGAEFSTLELFSYLKDKGVTILICKTKEMRPEYQPDAFGLDKNLIQTLPQLGFKAKRKALQNIIADFKPDIIHSVLFNSNLLVRTIRVFDSSFVHIESLVNHTYSSNRLNEPGVTKYKLEFYRWLDRITSYFGTDHFHPNGFSVAEHYQKALGISPKKMTVVHRGRRGENYEVASLSKSDFGIPENQLVLINVARQEYQKGQDVLFDAIAILPKDVRDKIHLLVVGREGKATPSLQKQVQEKGISSHISFLGHRTDIPALLNMSDIFVFPSRFEGLPGVLIEAEASGLPIICTHLSMMLEVVKVNENALTFEIDNPIQLAEAIEKLVTQPDLRNQFAKKSKEVFKENFQIESVHQKMYDLYQKLIQK
jgi:glycosyltransferase involved in cell wall biosynthesis